MKFTVLGASGFIGTAFVRYARSLGEECVTPDRGFTFSGGNLGHVIYAIGLTADFRSRPHDTIRAHVCLLNDILEKAVFDSFLYLSSTRVYGVGASGEEAEIHVRPEDPDHLYNLSKLMGESLCLSNENSKIRVARLSNVYGDDFKSENFLSSLLRDAVTGEVVFQSAPGSSKDYIWIDDVVKMLKLVATEGKARIYNIASGVNVNNQSLAGMIESLIGAKPRFLDEGKCNVLSPIDVRRIEKEFLFKPKQLPDVIPTLFQKYKEFHDSN